MCLDWDDGNTHKIKQRFTKDEVEEFFNQDLFIIEDKNHSSIEQRYIAVGSGPDKRSMFVCFTIRFDKIRVISARFMRKKEAKTYEKIKEGTKTKKQ